MSKKANFPFFSHFSWKYYYYLVIDCIIICSGALYRELINLLQLPDLYLCL